MPKLEDYICYIKKNNFYHLIKLEAFSHNDAAIKCCKQVDVDDGDAIVHVTKIEDCTKVPINITRQIELGSR